MASRVLIVDDEDEVRAVTVMAIKMRYPELTLYEAAGVNEARYFLEKLRVDVVLTDLVLEAGGRPGGLEVLKLAKEIDPFIMVIIFTARQLLLDPRKVLELGAFEFIDKVSRGRTAIEEILLKIETAIESRRLALKRNREHGL